MRFVAAAIALGFVGLATPAVAQEIVTYSPTVTYYAPSVPVTTYYAPSVPVTTYYAPSVPVTSYYAPTYTSYYAPAVSYYTPGYYYVPPRVARRWYRAGYWW